MIDIFINGPGFGESIVLRWKGNDDCIHAVLIDCYSVGAATGGCAMSSWLRDLGVKQLDLIVLTHPHLDHIQGIGGLLEAYKGSVKRVVYWGGMAPQLYLAYFLKLRRYVVEYKSEDLGRRAESLLSLFDQIAMQSKESGLPTLEDVPMTGDRVILDARCSDGYLIKLTACSPWARQLGRFTESISSGLRHDQVVTDSHQRINDASIGLICQYGESYFVLGGDVECDNWSEWCRSTGGHKSVSASVIKMSHHGSENGMTLDMWQRKGFYGGRPFPIVIVTPWKAKLPQASVIRTLLNNDFKIVLTGQVNNSIERPWLSFVEVNLDASGNAWIARRSDSILYSEYPADRERIQEIYVGKRTG